MKPAPNDSFTTRPFCSVEGCLKFVDEHGRLGRYHWNGTLHWRGDGSCPEGECP